MAIKDDVAGVTGPLPLIFCRDLNRLRAGYAPARPCHFALRRHRRWCVSRLQRVGQALLL